VSSSDGDEHITNFAWRIDAPALASTKAIAGRPTAGDDCIGAT
jgi:hypothetical protein